MLLKEAIPLPMLPGKVFVRKNDIDKCPWPSLCSNMPLVTRYDEVQSLLFQIFFIFSETLKLTMPIFGKEQVLITIYLNLTIFEQKLMKEPLVLVAELGKSVFFTYNPKLESSYKRGWP